MPQPRDLSEREADALASMMGADSRRIDDLVTDVGEIRGDVRAVRHQVGEVAQGVAEMTKSLAVLIKHEVLMEQHGAAVAAQTRLTESIDQRLHVVEREMPGLIESRADARRVQWLVIAAVVAAVLGVVLVKLP